MVSDWWRVNSPIAAPPNGLDTNLSGWSRYYGVTGSPVARAIFQGFCSPRKSAAVLQTG